MQFFDDKILNVLFSENTARQVLLDMLYENKKYDDVVRIHGNLDKNGHLRASNRRHLDVIILATYYRLVVLFVIHRPNYLSNSQYKQLGILFEFNFNYIPIILPFQLQNTLEALDRAYALWRKISEMENHQYRKSRTFVAGLAVNQKKPRLALEIIEDKEQQLYVTNRHILLLAWTQLEQYDDIVEMLRHSLTMSRETEKKFTTSMQVVSFLDFCFVHSTTGS